MRVALLNTNRSNPPIAPIGLDYVAEALHAAGHDIESCDLCWAEDWESSLNAFFSRRSFDLAGVTLRNTDDCSFASRRSFMGEFAAMLNAVRAATDAPVIIGGCGFSIMPEGISRRCVPDAGVWADGEIVFPELAGRIERGEEWADLPGVISLRGGEWRRNHATPASLENLPRMRRRWFDNERYFREGGQAGIETKRGCPRRCIYCADPIAKGAAVRTRPPSAVADELEELLGQGIDHIHTCDSEFNIPEDHAMEVCREIIGRNLGGRLRWYAYCAPVPFSPNLAGLMRRSGCAGINFGVDSGDDRMLKRLGRSFTSGDILSAVRACTRAGITVMLDLLIGAPGESRESIVRTIETARRAGADRIGVAIGVRVYPGTAIARMVAGGKLREGLTGGDPSVSQFDRPGEPVTRPPASLLSNDAFFIEPPLFFLEPAVAPFVSKLCDELIEGDHRFLFFDPERPERNYNYDSDRLLVDAIRRGYRGAYWDILRRLSP